MRRIRYAVAMSLDAYVAGPGGESDWIIMDPEIDFGEFFRQFDTVLVGRKTFEAMKGTGDGSMPGMKTLVFSRTLRQRDHPGVTVVSEEPEKILGSLRSQPGKDFWLFGGGSLFASLLGARLVDTVEVAVIPILLGGGVPLLPPPVARAKLRLVASKALATGTVMLEYAVEYGPADRGTGPIG